MQSRVKACNFDPELVAARPVSLNPNKIVRLQRDLGLHG
jgi:hypothetical protein